MLQPAAETDAPPLRSFVLILACVAALAAAFGAASLDGEFLNGDDEGLVRDHYLVNHPSWAHAAQLLGIVHGDLYQPVPMLTFMANYAVGRTSVRGYHVVNTAIHAGCAMMAALLAWRLARDARVGLLCGAMFACHPLAMESVAWITGRIMLLAAMFALIVILLFALRSERPGPAWASAAGVAWLLSLMSKVLPSVPIAALWTDWSLYGSDGAERGATGSPAGETPPAGGRSLPTRSRCWWAAVVVLLVETAALSGFAYYTTSRLDYFRLMQAESTTAWPARVMLASRYYFENYVWPSRLSAWSPPPQNVSVISPAVGVGALEWAGLIAIMIASRRRCRTAFVGIGLFILLLAPFLAAMAARTFLTADRYMYLPIVGLHLAAAAWIVKWAGGPAMRSRAAASAAGVCIVGVLGLWMRQGWSTAAVFHDDLSQAHRAIACYPDDVRAWTELARTHVKLAEEAASHGDRAAVREHTDAALRIVAEQRRLGHDDASLAAEAGEARWHAGDAAGAAAELTAAVAGLPRHQQAKYYLGLALQSLGQSDRACALWREILSEKSNFLPAATALARACRDNGNRAEAQRWFEKALELNGHHRGALSGLADLHMERGEWSKAEPLLRRLIDDRPTDAAALMNLAVVRTRQGDARQALELYDRLLPLAPDNAEARFNRAAVLAALQRRGEAAAAYREILARWPGHRATLIGLHELLAATGRMDELAAMWRKAADGPSPPEDAPAWLAFALALAGRPGEALPLAQGVAPADAGALLATWTLAWIELARSPVDADRLGPAVDAAAARPVPDTRRREQLRAVIMVLTEYSRTHPDDVAAGYVLARALRQNGQPELARRFLERSAQLGQGTPWGERARSLLQSMPTSAPGGPRS